MQIDVYRDLRDYHEDVLMGLSLRQLLFSIVGIGAAAVVYLKLSTVLGQETTSWLCILVALPPVVFGFFQRNNIPTEKLLFYILESCAMRCKPRVWRCENAFNKKPAARKQILKKKARR